MFFTGFTQLAGVFNKLTEAEQTLFPLVKSVSEAVNTAGRDCEDNYNCVYEGDEAEIFEQILQSGEHKSRYPRQADSQYYPSNETESVNSSLKKETEENSEEGSKAGFTSKLKGYYDKVANMEMHQTHPERGVPLFKVGVWTIKNIFIWGTDI